MWALVCITHLWIRFSFTYPLVQGEACKDKIVLGKTPHRLTLRGVRLCVVLVVFGFSENLIVYSVQC